MTQATGTEMATITIRNKTSMPQMKKVNAFGNGIAGVKFSLYRQITTTSGDLEPDHQPISGYVDMATGADGILDCNWADLNRGTYYLRETYAPNDYIQLNKDDTGTITITNSYNPEKTSAKVIKVWDDAENQDGKRPESISVTLKAGDTTVETVTLNEANSWTYEKKDLDKYAGGVEIEYTWTEDESKLPEGYSLKSSDKVGTVTTLTNTYEPETTKITAIKHWKDDSESGKPRKNVEATFHLQKTVDGVSTEIDSVKVGTEQSWTYVWTDLPVYENGKKITYSVKEVLTKANGYKSDTTKWKVVENGGKITITNTLQDATPGTGDNTKTLLWGSLMLTSAVGCGGALWIAGRKKKEER